MPSNKEILFQQHICDFLEREHHYRVLSKADLPDQEFHIIPSHLIEFISATQPEQYQELKENYGADADAQILNALVQSAEKKPLWLAIRSGIEVRGIPFTLYKPKPRSSISSTQQALYEKNILAFKKEYRYNVLTEERIDLVIWLNGLPIIVIELKHEDEGQNCEDAIYESFLHRDFNNNIYTYPFLYVASSNTEVKVATNPRSEKNFRWFNTNLVNYAETEGEYPVEHLYRHAFSKENITAYLEHFLIFSPAKEKINPEGVLEKIDSFSIFPRYHQLRAGKNISQDVFDFVNQNKTLGKKYLVNHSAGSGKTLTIAWLADLLDSLYDNDRQKVFDNIIILTDRRSLDKNVKDDLENFTHLKDKINFTKRSEDLADFLKKDRDIIVTTIHKFSHIQDKLKDDVQLRNRKVAFLIDEAHRSQEGKLAYNTRQFFTNNENETEEEEPTEEDEIVDKLKNLNISNQVFVAFTATTTPKSVAFFGEPFDTYSEEEAIKEGYILDVAHNIISYETLYHLRLKEIIPQQDFPAGVVSKALKTLAYNDIDLIQYKSEVIVNLFEKNVVPSINGKGKAMVVTSSRPAGLKYFRTLQTILKEKQSPYKVLFAFSDFIDPETNEKIEEIKLNELDTLHDGKIIEEVFELSDYRILVVANKFQTGFDQPLLSTMFLDKPVNGVNAIQTVSRLNRKHKEKEQEDIIVVDFTNNAAKIFEAFNKHRKGSPFKEKEPKPEVLQSLYDEIRGYQVFSDEQISDYIAAYLKAEQAAKEKDSSADAALSNLNQQYREHFKLKLTSLEKQKEYVSLLRRYTKLYYFIAQFFDLNQTLSNFIVFAEVMGDMLIKKGKTSDLKKFLDKIELSKGAVKYHGLKTNMSVVKEPRKTGAKTGGAGFEPPRTTIESALEQIRDKFDISDEDAIVIKEICETICKRYDIKDKIIANKDNENYLQTSAKPKVKKEIRGEYEKRNLWEKLEDPIYIGVRGRGGIISLMGETVIRDVIGSVG